MECSLVCLFIWLSPSVHTLEHTIHVSTPPPRTTLYFNHSIQLHCTSNSYRTMQPRVPAHVPLNYPALSSMIYTPTHPVQIPAGVDMPLKKVLGVDFYFLVLVLSDCRLLAMSDRPHPYLRPPPGAYVAADGSIAMISGKGFSNWTLSVDSATANSFLLDHPSAYVAIVCLWNVSSLILPSFLDFASSSHVYIMPACFIYCQSMTTHHCSSLSHLYRGKRSCKSRRVILRYGK
jgi:hypothetical protein